MKALITFIAILTVGIVTAQDNYRKSIWRYQSNIIEVSYSIIVPDNCLAESDFGGTFEISVHRNSDGDVIRRSLDIGVGSDQESYNIVDESHYDLLADVLEMEPGFYAADNGIPTGIPSSLRGNSFKVHVPASIAASVNGWLYVQGHQYDTTNRVLLNDGTAVYYVQSRHANNVLVWSSIGGASASRFRVSDCGVVLR